MPIGSVFDKYRDGEVHTLSVIPPKSPVSLRNAVYPYAKKHGLAAQAYIRWETLPFPEVVFQIAETLTEPLPGAPPRGSRAHTPKGQE